MFTMFLNHFALTLLDPNTILFEVFVNIGYFTAITMCYFLVEGYGYTHSKKKYAQRLAVFAFVSEIPYVLALGYYQLNMMFTLLMCFGILVLLDKKEMGMKRYILVILLVFVSVFSDWALMAPVFTIMFAVWKNNKNRQALAYILAAVVFGLFNYMNYAGAGYPFGEAILHTLCSILGIIVSGIVILCFYNGKCALRGKKFSKWFFYVFYPAHLAILAVIRIAA